MAASDPATDVPTPTGTLQGVAVFSWDGSAWQPAGRAGPSVATPTGVLRGVAAFNGGPSWQPAGQAQPGVATPTGTLDGVAVYTWTGDSWAPPGGTATPSTPHGALRGVAAFNWDGAAWQPAAQAGPSVATPYGVLDGVAMFNWSGSAWAAVGAPSLSLDFMQPGTLDPRITCTRASTATYFNSAGVMQTAAANAPRWDYNPATLALQGLLIEEARTNTVFYSGDASQWGNTAAVIVTANAATAPDNSNSAAKVVADTTLAQHCRFPSAAITANTWNTGSVYVKMAGLPRVTLLLINSAFSNGAQAAFDLTTGSQAGPVTFVGTTTLGTASIVPVGRGWFRCTISAVLDATSTNANLLPYLDNGTGAYFTGDGINGLLIWGAQVEQGAFPTSLIPTTAAAVTRAIDQCGITSANMGWFLSPGGSWQAEFISLNPASSNLTRIIAYPLGTGSLTPLCLLTGLQLLQYDGATLLQTANSITVGAVSKAASTYLPGTGTVCLNGGAVASTAMTNGYGVLATAGINLMMAGAAGDLENTTGWLRRVRYWPRVLTNAELQAVTT